jgi:hypothetical protein
MARKQDHELSVFSGFVSASGLTIPPDSICAEEPPLPDIRCTLAGAQRFFELAEVLWKDPDPQAPVASLAHGLAQSERASRRKAALRAEGRIEEAEQIQTWGGFGSPPLAALLQLLDKKCVKQYETDQCPLSLLLYYERANPSEPFDRLIHQTVPRLTGLV